MIAQLVARYLEKSYLALSTFFDLDESEQRIRCFNENTQTTNMGVYETKLREFVALLLLSREDHNTLQLGQFIDKINDTLVVPNNPMIASFHMLRKGPTTRVAFVGAFRQFVMYYEHDIRSREILYTFFDSVLSPYATSSALNPSHVLIRLMHRRPMEQNHLPILPIVAMCQLLLLCS